MIRSLSGRALRTFWETGRVVKGIDPKSVPKLRRLLSELHSAPRPEDINIPGNELRRSGRNYELKVRAHWFLTFEWKDGAAVRVKIEDRG